MDMPKFERIKDFQIHMSKILWHKMKKKVDGDEFKSRDKWVTQVNC